MLSEPTQPDMYEPQAGPEYGKLRNSWVETSRSPPPSRDYYQTFIKAIRNDDMEAVELHLLNWCKNTSDIKDFLTFIDFVKCISCDRPLKDPTAEDGFKFAVFKGLWQAFYHTVANFLSSPPDNSFGDLIAETSSIMDVVDSCRGMILLDIHSCQIENSVCASVAKVWSHLTNTARLNAKLVNSLPWRDIQVSFSQKLVGVWSYIQSDEILHAFLTSQLRFYEYLPVNSRVLKEWSVFQSYRENFEENYVACIRSLDSAKGVEKNLKNSLNNFKSILEAFDHQMPPVNNKPKKMPHGTKAYGQLEMMNDIQSLRRVIHYLSLTRSFNHDPENISSRLMHVLLIERVLQVTGESIKNTAGSPNLSVKKRKMLEKAKVPLQMLSELRNVLSHFNCLLVERKQRVESDINLQSVLIELAKLEDVFTKALRRIEFTLLLELVKDESLKFDENSVEAQFLISLGGCRSFAQIEEKMRGRMSDVHVRQLYFLIQQFDIQSKVCKMESLFSSINGMDVKQDNVIDIWQDLAVEKQEVAKSTLSEISEMKNIEELLQDLSMPTAVKSSKIQSSSGDFLEKFIDTLAHKYMSPTFYASVAQDLFLGKDFPVDPKVVEMLLDSFGDAEFATKDDRRHAVSALRLLDAVLHLKSVSGATPYVNGKLSKETLDCLSDSVANAHFQPVTERQLDEICQNIAIDDDDVRFVMRIILIDMLDSICDETDHGIYSIIEKVIGTCCSAKYEEQVKLTKEGLTLKVARLKMTAHIKAIASKKEGLLTEEEFSSCRAVVNDALIEANMGNVQSLFSCSNGRLREGDLKLLKNMAFPFEKLCGRLKETKSLDDSVKAFDDYLAGMLMSNEERSAALSCFRSIQQDSLESFVVLRIKQLQQLLEKNGISTVSDVDNGSYATYKCNHYLRAAVEMILLECHEILDNLYVLPSCQINSQCSNCNMYWTISSTDLRNYLAHGNSLLEAYDSNICNHVLQNAIELVINGECIMALRKLFEDGEIYSFIRCATINEELHTVHVGTMTALSKRDIQHTVEKLQSNPNWECIVKKCFEKELGTPGSILNEQTMMVDSNITLSMKLMAEDALNLMLRNHLNQLSILVRANPLICKHTFRDSWTLLHYAVSLKQNAVNAIDILLKAEADVNATDDRNLTPLHLAVLFKSYVGVEKLLSHENIDVDAQNMEGVTALHIASQQGTLSIVRLLCNSHANTYVQTHKMWSALHFAVSYGHESVVQVLLQSGTNPNIIGEHKWTPLLLATHQNQESTMKILLNHGADSYATLVDDPFHASRGAIHLAASYGSPECIQLLLDKGVDVDKKCPDYRYGNERRPLHLAVIYGMEENVKFLISNHGVDKNSTDGNGCTAIDYALMSNNTSLVKLLLQHDCKLKSNAIIDVASKGNLEMLKLLHDRGANLDCSVSGFFEHPFTPSIAATIAGKLNVLKFLLKTVDSDTHALMHAACMFGCRSIVQYLIEEKYFPDPSCHYRERRGTPLHTAAECGRLSLVRYLAEDLSVSIDLVDENGNTPSMLACSRKAWAVVNYFLKHGADVSGERGGRMASIAAYHEQWAVVRELIDNGASLDDPWIGKELDENTAVVVTAACKSHLGLVDYLIEKQHLDLQALPQKPLLLLLATCAKQNVLHYLAIKGLEMTSICDENGATGLHHAALAGNLNALTFFLVDRNCPVDQVDMNGYSALHYAIRGRQAHIVRHLLEANANAKIKSCKGESPMMLAFQVRNYDNICQLAQHEDLLSAEFPDKEGNSFLQSFTKLNFASRLFRTWIDHDSSNIFHKNNVGETVLHSVIQIDECIDVFFLILNKGKAIATESTFSDFLNGRDRNGNSTLMLIVSKSPDSIVTKAVALFLNYSPDLNVQNCQRQTVLHLAVQRLNMDVLCAFLQPLEWFLKRPGTSVLHVADPRLRNSDNLTPLELAQRLGDKVFIDKMRCYEFNYKLYILQDEEERAKAKEAQVAAYATMFPTNPMCKAALECDLQYVRQCLETQPSLRDLRTFRGNLPIHSAAVGGSVDVLECLISAGSCITAINDLGQNALHIAASHGHVPAVNYLIGTVGLRCSVFDKEGNKPVHSAIRSGMVNVLLYLFEKGLSNVNDLDENDETPLQIASMTGQNKVIEFLLTKYDAAAASPLGNCAILNEAIFNGHLSTVALLVKKGALADIMETGLTGHKSPLYMAIKNECWPIAKLLLESVKQDELKFFLADNGAALLNCAAGCCQLDVVMFLVERAGLDPNVPVERGETSLMAACCLGKVEVVEYLLSRNANPNAFNYTTKQTALHRAAKLGRAEAARALIDYHADILAEDSRQETALDTAARYNNWDVAIVILRNAGRHTQQLYDKLALLQQSELKRHAESKGIFMSFHN